MFSYRSISANQRKLEILTHLIPDAVPQQVLPLSLFIIATGKQLQQFIMLLLRNEAASALGSLDLKVMSKVACELPKVAVRILSNIVSPHKLELCINHAGRCLYVGGLLEDLAVG